LKHIFSGQSRRRLRGLRILSPEPCDLVVPKNAETLS
jgi:hypothetical protein